VTWRATDISVGLDEAASEGAIATVLIRTPAGTLRVMATVRHEGRRVTLLGVHIQGEDVAVGRFGWVNLRRAGQALLEWFGNHDELVVEGAVRTSGASPGRHPRVIRFTRGLRAQKTSS
jgi:hypothetical protein